MVKIGIDYSLTSPAICVYKNGEYSFISFFDDDGKDWQKSKSKSYRYHNLLTEFMEMNPYTREKTEKVKSKKLKSSDSYRTEQKIKMQNAKMIAKKIVDRLVEIVGDEEAIIGLEGFSYGSISSSTLDLALYNSFLRIKLLEVFGEDCLVIIAPTEGKKVLSGKGNANKDAMIKAFIENHTGDTDIERTDLWKFCKENELDYNNIKPIDDLVDSFGILKSI